MSDVKIALVWLACMGVIGFAVAGIALLVGAAGDTAAIAGVVAGAAAFIVPFGLAVLSQ